MNTFPLSILRAELFHTSVPTALPLWLLPVYEDLRRGRRVLMLCPQPEGNVSSEPLALLQEHGVSAAAWSPSAELEVSLNELREGFLRHSVLVCSCEVEDSLLRRLHSAFGTALLEEGLSPEEGLVHGDKDARMFALARKERVRVGLCGLGSVGAGVLRWLQSFPDQFELCGIAVRSLAKDRPPWVPRELLVEDPWEVLERGPQLLIEVMGGLKPTFALLSEALSRGVSVVSANKDLFSLHGRELESLARASGAGLSYAAAVGGGVPALETTRQLVRGEEIVAVEGILNGTTNFVLGQMEAGLLAEEAVLKAQQAGFAEADPSSDLSGLDAAYKLTLLAKAAFGCEISVEEVSLTGIEGLSREQIQAALREGECYRLVASCHRRGGVLEAVVRPVRVALESPFAKTREEYNLVRWSLSDQRALLSYGKGAGRWPTALAVFADVVEIWENRRERRVPGEALQRRRCA